MSAITIEPIKVSEVEEISRLVVSSIRAGLSAFSPAEVIGALVEGNSPEAIRRHAPKQTDYVMHSDDRFLGMIGLKRNEIGHLFVTPAESGKGLGRRLVNFAHKTFRDAGQTEMVVLASLNAIGFYGRCGFTEQSRGSFAVGDGLELNYVRMTCSIEGRNARKASSTERAGTGQDHD